MKKSISRILLLALAAVIIIPTRSSAFRINASADTIRLSSGVGQLATYDLYVTDGRDSTGQPRTPLTYANASISGTGDFRFGSDTNLAFFGSEILEIQYSASSSTPSNEVLNIQGDSNTIHVVLIGIPPDHQNLWIGGEQDFDTLSTGTETCDSMTLYNPNSFSVTITDLWIASQGTFDRLSNVPTTPFTLAARQKIWFSACITGSEVQDTSLLGGIIHAAYTFGMKADTASYPIYGQLRIIDSTCLTFTAPNQGEAAVGSTVEVPVGIDNPTNNTISVDSVTIISGDTVFHIDNTQFPIQLFPRSSGTFQYSFSAPDLAQDNQAYSAVIMIYVDGKSKAETPCHAVPLGIDGIAVIPVTDTIVLDAPPGGASTVTITTNQMLSRHGILIRNDTSVTIVPSSLQITSPTQYAYFYTPFYETLTLFDSLLPWEVSSPAQVMTFNDIDTGTFDIDLTLSYHYPRAFQKTEITTLPTYQYHVILHRVPTGAASVNPPPSTGQDFSIVPNPAHGDVTIQLPTDVTSTIEIYDVLGNLVMRKLVQGMFLWDGRSETGNFVSDGVYVVRVSNEAQSSGSKRLILLH